MTRRKKKRNSEQGRNRSVYLLPNLFTTASLFAGFYGIISAIDGNYVFAAWLILVSLIFDGLDGKVARATNSVSRFGVEYDSLADVLSFGMAPALIVFMWALRDYDRLGWLACCLFVACGALRLARFNVQVDKVGTSHFVGLPIPAAATMLATTILCMDALGYSAPPQPLFLLIMVLVLSFLMVSNIHYLAFKELAISHLKSFNGVFVMLLFVVLLAVHPQGFGFALLVLYVVLGPVACYIKERRIAARSENQIPPSQDTLTPAQPSSTAADEDHL